LSLEAFYDKLSACYLLLKPCGNVSGKQLDIGAFVSSNLVFIHVTVKYISQSNKDETFDDFDTEPGP